MWRDANVREWSSEIDPERRYGRSSASFVVGSAVIAAFSLIGIAFGAVHGIQDFRGASILAFSAVTYALMAVSYFLYARRLRAASWFAPLWFASHIPACILTILEMRRVSGGAGALPSLPESSRRAGDPGCRTR